MKFDPIQPKLDVRAVVYQVTVTVMNDLGEEREFRAETQHFDEILNKLYTFKKIINDTYNFREPDVTEF